MQTQCLWTLPCPVRGALRIRSRVWLVGQFIKQNELFEMVFTNPVFVTAWEARGGGSWTSPYPGLFRPCPVRGALMCPPTPSRNGRASFY